MDSLWKDDRDLVCVVIGGVHCLCISGGHDTVRVRQITGWGCDALSTVESLDGVGVAVSVVQSNVGLERAWEVVTLVDDLKVVFRNGKQINTCETVARVVSDELSI